MILTLSKPDLTSATSNTMSYQTILAVLLLSLGITGCIRESPLFKRAANHFDEQSTAEAKAAIERSPEFRQLDAKCASLPFIKGSRLLKLSMGAKSQPKLFYYYESDVRTEDLKKEHRAFLVSQGWKISEEGNNFEDDFAKYELDGYRLNIFYRQGIDGKYSIACEQMDNGTKTNS